MDSLIAEGALLTRPTSLGPHVAESVSLLCVCPAAVEWTLPAARLWPPAFLPFCFSLGTMGGAPLAWLSPSWTYLHLLLALPQIVCLPLYLYARLCRPSVRPVRSSGTLSWFPLSSSAEASQNLLAGCCYRGERMFWRVTVATALQIKSVWTW